MTRTLVTVSYLASPGQSVSRFSDTDVETQLPDLQVSHHILGLILLRHLCNSLPL